MTRDELIQEFRVQTQDLIDPYLWRTPWVANWLEEAEAEACIRGRLLHVADDPALCEIAIAPGQRVYPLHPMLYELDHLGIKEAGEARRRPVRLVSTEYLDAHLPDWRDRSGRVEYVVQDDTSLRLVPTPTAAGTLLLEGYRLPLGSLAASGSARPEINDAHHRHLIDWALFRAFSMPTAETLDLTRAQVAAQAFERYFGPRPDSDLRRITREDVEHHNTAWI